MPIPEENKVYVPLTDGRYAVINREPTLFKTENIIIRLQNGDRVSVKPQKGSIDGKFVVIQREGENLAFNYEEIVDTLPSIAIVCPLTGKI